MQNSQTLANLANSAKASQEEFNNTLIEIHKQSARKIEQELKQTYEKEMSEIKRDITSQLTEAMNEVIAMKNERLQKIITGKVLIAILVAFFIGMALSYFLCNSIIQELKTWQVPNQMRFTTVGKNGKIQQYIVVKYSEVIDGKDGKNQLYRIK